MRLIVAQHAAAPVQRDGRLIALLIKAHAARKQLIDAEGSIDASFSPSHLARMARLAFLAPDIIAAILDGTQPPSLTARRLLRASELPLCWAEQRRRFGFGCGSCICTAGGAIPVALFSFQATSDGWIGSASCREEVGQ